VHAAGVIQDGPLLAKSPGTVEDVFTPKIHGTQVLDALFPDGALDWMALFSSTSTVTAPAGQVDYVAANEYLNAYAKSRAGGRTKVVAINWGIWAEVGMAAEAVAKRLGARAEAPGEPAGMPLLDEARFDAAGHRIFTASFSPETRWLLDEHRTKAGDALVPGTGYLELAAEALRANGETGPFEIRNLFFLRPFQVADGRERVLRLRLARSDEGYGLQVQGACTVDGRPAFETNAQGAIALLPLPAPAPVDLAALKARCAKKRLGDGRASFPRSRRRICASGRAGGCCAPWPTARTRGGGSRAAPRLRQGPRRGLSAPPRPARPRDRLGDGADRGLRGRKPLGAGLLPQASGSIVPCPRRS
jgi:hypothetical protein